ncbi:Small nuclear ribonucleoprotein E [Quillaja saponaria]|uniref:Sm protein E n=1 Tax=Quillaja saponaria TaxID=32244 RepID=A0AAD7QDN8_QUISA|nr:Small nuclear ribonucleoprotein E [Quillaja saponaria]
MNLVLDDTKEVSIKKKSGKSLGRILLKGDNITLIDEHGFDEYMNLVLDDTKEVSIKKKSGKSLGRILLKGDNITLMMNTLEEYQKR